MKHSQRPLIAGLLAILLALVVTLTLLVAVVLRQRGSAADATATLATATPVATPTPILSITPAQGWVEIKPTMPWVRNVAFGTNDPLTGYACGSIDGKALLSSSTTDGGRTWQPSQALAFGTGYFSCALQVDPANAKDVLLGLMYCGDYEPCEDATEETPYHWYRTLDGGQTWNPLVDPPGVATAEAHNYVLIHNFSWVGSTLYAKVRSFAQSGDPYPLSNYFLVSKNGDALTGLDNPAFYTALGPNAKQPSEAFSVPFASNGGIAVLYGDISKGIAGGISSSDGGHTWTPFTPHVTGAPAIAADDIRIAASNSTTLYGYFVDSQQNSNAPLLTLLQSHDGGHTWDALPAPLPGALDPFSFFYNTDGGYNLVNIVVTPDGTLFTFVTGAGGGVVRLTPKATAWQVLDPFVSSSALRNIFKTVSWDTQGHPVALWGEKLNYMSASDPSPSSYGLSYHAPVAAG